MVEYKKSIITKSHSLFIEEKSESKKLVKKDIYEIKPGRNIYHLYIGDFDSDEKLNEIFAQLNKANSDDEIILHINSYGGQADELKRFLNILDSKFKGRNTGILESNGYSAGGLLFLACEKRVAYEYSSLMLHSYLTVMSGKHIDIEKEFEYNKKDMEQLFDKILVKSKLFTKREVEDMINGIDFWLDYKDMLKRGIVTHEFRDGELCKIKRRKK